MKFAINALFLLVATKSAVFADEEPCLDLESLTFPADCQINGIFSTIKTEWRAIKSTCEHNARKEAMLLANMPTLPQAKIALQNYCLGVERCIDDLEDFDVDNCTFDEVVEGIEDQLPDDCTHNAVKELEIMFAAKNSKKVRKKVEEMCGDAWSEVVDSYPFSEIDSDFSDSFMDAYTQGDTYLNTETGSFEDTDVGDNIDDFRDDQATDSILEAVPNLSQCKFNSIMCCFGRDRQPNDNNGNCADPIADNCVDADPADNSNLCYTDFDYQPFPGNEEGEIHCHGLAWADDENDPTSKLKFNNFFYVSLYDHMYTRGYVENMIDSDEVPMCGCIEDMPPVSRADCTEIETDTEFTISWGDYYPEAHLCEDYEFEYNACEGTNPSDGSDANNDLASYVFRLREENRISRRSQKQVFKTLVGYADPDDDENEEACASAYKKETGLEYPDA